jgi:hypothetical protein
MIDEKISDQNIYIIHTIDHTQMTGIQGRQRRAPHRLTRGREKTLMALVGGSGAES